MTKARKDKTQKKKRGAPTWTTEDQEAWLEQKKPEYIQAQQDGHAGISNFWKASWDDWFERWPLASESVDETEADPAKRKRDEVSAVKTVRICSSSGTNVAHHNGNQRVQAWFNNHTRGSKSGYGRKKVLDLSKKKSKKLPSYQAYQQLYYEEKIKDIVEKRWDEHLRSQPGYDEDSVPQVPSLAFRNRITRELFADESDEVKDKVEAHRNEEATDDYDELLDDMDSGLGKAEIKRRAKAVSYQR
jgi:hypothetical protein